VASGQAAPPRNVATTITTNAAVIVFHQSILIVTKAMRRLFRYQEQDSLPPYQSAALNERSSGPIRCSQLLQQNRHLVDVSMLANVRFAPTTAIEQDASSFQMQRY
jgi:hypothetical protein